MKLPHTNLTENFFWYAEQCIFGGYQEKEIAVEIIKAFEQNKSIIIFGANGTGKTLLFELLKRVVHPQNELRFRGRNVLDTVLDFNTRGHECFRDDQKSHVFYDDLGTEDKGYWYGDKVEVFEKLMQFRYDRWRTKGLRTFFTTNLTHEEILQRYGSRFRDRMKEQFYQAVMVGESKRNLKNFIKFMPIEHNRVLSPEEEEWNANYKAHKQARQNMPKEETKTGVGSQLRKQFEQMKKNG